eukprot:scaffold11840_cov48-Phaeocystis_antarctica.AAC.1
MSSNSLVATHIYKVPPHHRSSREPPWPPCASRPSEGVEPLEPGRLSSREVMPCSTVHASTQGRHRAASSWPHG